MICVGNGSSRCLPPPLCVPISAGANGLRTMSKPVVVNVPHRLGREEAARRIRNGFERAGTQFAGILNISNQSWTGDRLSFSFSALGQQADGTIDVMDSEVRIEVTLPWLLAK